MPETLDSVQKMNRVILHGKDVDDETLRNYRAFKRRSHLSLIETSISDVGLNHICEHPGIVMLTIAQSSDVTESGITQLQGMPNLQRLELSDLDEVDQRRFRIYDGGLSGPSKTS